MVDLYKEIDYSQELQSLPELESYLKAKSKEFQEDLSSDKIKKPFLERSFNEFIIVVGLPNAEASKTESFKTFFKSTILSKLNLMINVQQIEFHLDSNGNFQGIAILKFDNEENATEGLSKLNGLKFLKYELSAYSHYSFQQVLAIPDEFNPPLNLPKQELFDWNSESIKSQLTLQIGLKSYSFWVSHLESEPQNIFIQSIEEGKMNRKEKKCNYYFEGKKEQNSDDYYTHLQSQQSKLEWSKNGTYLAEIVEDGFFLYGGPQLQRLSFFPHQGIKQIEFSPCENYILSYNGTIVEAPDEDNFIVWLLSEVKKIRIFKALQQDIWGSFKWCHDSKYIGRIQDHKISVYELPLMNMISDSQGNPNSINIRNIQKFFWCSKQNIIIGCSYLGNLREHDKQVSTRISLFEIPNRREMKWRTISSEATDIDVVPSANGQFLIAILKKTKSKKTSSYTIQVGNLRNKGQMEISEVEINDRVLNYVIDPIQGRIGLVYYAEENRGEASTMLFHSHIFQVEEESRSFVIKDCGRFNNKNTNEILFSNNSGFFALINKDLHSAHCGIMETGYTRKEKGKIVSEITKTYNNLSYMNQASYDQTGRYIVTSSQKTKSYQLWTAYGEQIFKDTVAEPSGITAIKWRPRLTWLLNENIQSDIQSNLKNFKKQYEDEDLKITNRKEWERKERRERQKKEFMEYLIQKRTLWQETKEERHQTLGYDEEDESDIVYDEFIENERVIKTEVIDEENKQQSA